MSKTIDEMTDGGWDILDVAEHMEKRALKAEGTLEYLRGLLEGETSAWMICEYLADALEDSDE